MKSWEKDLDTTSPETQNIFWQPEFISLYSSTYSCNLKALLPWEGLRLKVKPLLSGLLCAAVSGKERQVLPSSRKGVLKCILISTAHVSFAPQLLSPHLHLFVDRFCSGDGRKSCFNCGPFTIASQSWVIRVLVNSSPENISSKDILCHSPQGAWNYNFEKQGLPSHSPVTAFQICLWETPDLFYYILSQ